MSVSSDTAVPTCPGWTVQRLLQHVGRVFDMVIRVVQTADPLSRPARVAPPPSGDVLAMFDDRLATMLDVLATTDPGAPAWHPGPTAPMTAAGTVALARKTQASPSTAARSDGERELGERSREPMPRVYVSGKFVVAAANVLDKGMADADHPY